jgi:hypothetical protein
MLGKAVVVVIATAVLVGFSSVSEQLKVRMERMPQHYSQFDMKIGWNVTNGSISSTTIDGIVKNVRYVEMENIEVWASLLDSNGKLLARSVDYVIPTRLGEGELAPFTIKLPAVASAGSKLIFTYKYFGSDGGGDTDNTRWMQSFESTL